MMRFDRFTERAQEAAQRAAEIIQRYGHNQIDTEHILLALIEQPGGVIPQILEKLSVSAEALTERLDATLRASPKANIFGGGAGQIFITPRIQPANPAFVIMPPLLDGGGIDSGRQTIDRMERSMVNGLWSFIIVPNGGTTL